jgi:hypothetical protein
LTEPGEWFNVDRAGVYIADLLYTSNRDGSLTLDIKRQVFGEAYAIVSTFDGTEGNMNLAYFDFRKSQ